MPARDEVYQEEGETEVVVAQTAASSSPHMVAKTEEANTL